MKATHISLGLFSLIMASSVHAAPEVEIGSEYQINVVNTNDGLNPDGAQNKTTSLNLKGAKILLRGKLSDQISWTVFYKAKEGELERFYLTNKVNDSLDITIGKQKIKTYGLHRKLTSGTTTPVLGAILDQNPLKDKVAIDITYKLAGTISLQLVDDYSKCKSTDVYTNDPATNVVKKTTTASCDTWNNGSAEGIVTNSKETQTIQKQPALAFEWYGAFGDISPLVQYAVYDLGKSSTASAGVRYKHEGIDAYFDYTMDTRNYRGIDTTDPAAPKAYKQKNTFAGMVAYAEYKVSDYTPFVHFSTLATDPYEAATATDADKNIAESNANGKLDRNESTIAIGTHFDNWGAFYRPFVDVTMSSGKYLKDATGASTETRSKTDLVAGLIGKF